MKQKQIKNKITTESYFVKRLKDSKFITYRIFNKYALSDPRRWTILVDPEQSGVYITCYENKEFKGEVMFEFYDGGCKFPGNFSLKTSSMEVIVYTLLDRGVQQHIFTNEVVQKAATV
jgi:hypothetical protein